MKGTQLKADAGWRGKKRRSFIKRLRRDYYCYRMKVLTISETTLDAVLSAE